MYQLGLIIGQGEYKTILQLVGVLSHGKTAKRLTDKAIDLMQDVQNLRKAIYEFVLFFGFIRLFPYMLMVVDQLQTKGKCLRER